MREIGGFIELDKYAGCVLHSEDIALNSGRNCLRLLIRKKAIKRLYIPKYLCSCIGEVCEEESVEVVYYSIGSDFLPSNLPQTDEWVYLVNYYGQISNEQILSLRRLYPSLIVDNVQAYFQEPVAGVDTFYSCRKFFGVPDGAFLHSDIKDDGLAQDVSYERMKYILGRVERPASELYGVYLECEKEVASWVVLRMSKLTKNLLSGIDYENVRRKRECNFAFLNERLREINQVKVRNVAGPYMYPLYLRHGAEIRKRLLDSKIYIPTLWPDVFGICEEKELEYDMALNILPLPCDQRYSDSDMQYMVDKLIVSLHRFGYDE